MRLPDPRTGWAAEVASDADISLSRAEALRFMIQVALDDDRCAGGCRPIRPVRLPITEEAKVAVECGEAVPLAQVVDEVLVVEAPVEDDDEEADHPRQRWTS
ncbi:MAG: hypothetical protein QJR03_16320 [Sphaerobacter sp.]|nr:hypothetical protein [Sphaerobacter sp.]